MWRWEHPIPLRWLLVDEHTMGEPDTPVAVCSDIDGLFIDPPPPPPVRPATLLGCRPEPKLRAALDALVRGAGNPGGAPHRRRIRTFVYGVGVDGTVGGVVGDVSGSVAGALPSKLGDGLLDVTLDTGIADPKPAGAREIWERWRIGGSSGPGEWAGYDRDLRAAWADAAGSHRRTGPDRPAGTTYHLDGRHVTDIEGFYCALGEAVNGPGGYFGSNLDALHDCATGGGGAATPFRLVWHDAAVARAHLVPGYDRRRWGPAVTLDDLLAYLAEDRIDVELVD
jgi:RNAse (barnase) inhibitor barstar